MSNFKKTACAGAVAAAFGMSAALPAFGADDALEERVEKLEKKLEAVKKDARSWERAYTKWHLAGYTDVSFTSISGDGEEDSFGVGHFNPSFHWLYKDILLFEAELQFELEDGETNTELEYADLNFFVNDRLTVVAGKWLSPVGQFQERLHPTWINKLPDPPAGFGHGGAQPLSDVGVQARGGIPVGNSTLTYALGVGNGPQGGHHGPELEGFTEDNNSNKAISGRVGFLPMPGLEVGGSFLTAKIPGEEPPAGGATDGDFDLFGLDASYTRGSWTIRTEYLDSTLDEHQGAGAHGAEAATTIPETDWTAWYAQASRKFGKWEPVARIGEFEADGNERWEEDNQSYWSVGLNYNLAPSAIGKLAFTSADPDEGGDFETYTVQFAYGF